MQLLSRFLRLVLLTLVTGGAVAFASPAWADGNAAGAGRTDYGTSGLSISYGFRGSQEIRANPPTPPYYMSWAHPMQVGFGSSGAFLGVGTYKGAGTVGTDGDGCASNDGAWSSYVEFQTALGTIKCFEIQHQAFTVGSNPEMEISTTTCGGGVHWAAFINGTIRRCFPDSFSGSMKSATVALEVATPTTPVNYPITQGYNIDVKFSELDVYNNQYQAWGALNPSASDEINNDFYSVVRPTTRRVNAFKGDLD